MGVCLICQRENTLAFSCEHPVWESQCYSWCRNGRRSTIRARTHHSVYRTLRNAELPSEGHRFTVTL
jgi:hypothetical protein